MEEPNPEQTAIDTWGANQQRWGIEPVSPKIGFDFGWTYDMTFDQYGLHVHNRYPTDPSTLCEDSFLTNLLFIRDGFPQQIIRKESHSDLPITKTTSSKWNPNQNLFRDPRGQVRRAALRKRLERRN